MRSDLSGEAALRVMMDAQCEEVRPVTAIAPVPRPRPIQHMQRNVKVTMTIECSAGVYQDIQAQARLEKVSRSTLAIKALNEYLQRAGRATQCEAITRAGDFCLSHVGPGQGRFCGKHLHLQRSQERDVA